MLAAEIGDLAGREIGVWGLAFKSGTDDIRDSLAFRILDELGRRGARVVRGFVTACLGCRRGDACADRLLPQEALALGVPSVP